MKRKRNPVWQLPVYGIDPYVAEAPDPVLADHDQQPPSSQESLWLLGSAEEEEPIEPMPQAPADDESASTGGVGSLPFSQDSLWSLPSAEDE